MKQLEKFTDKNNVRYILVPHKDSLTTTVLVLVEAGSKYETKNINGISHFLEHMVFKGTKNRPTAMAISKELDGIGAQYNAFTGQEWTGYYVKAANEHQEKILDVVSDLYLNPLLEEKEIEKEKGVVIEEINMYEDLPPRKVADIFMELLYGDQPAGWDVGGKKEIIQALKQSDVVDYRTKYYIAPKTIVVLSGKFDLAEMEKTLPKYFNSIHTGEIFNRKAVIEKQDKPQYVIKSKKVDQLHLLLGVRAFDVHDKRKHALQILMNHLGGGMSSVLFQRIREEMGAAYYVKADAELLSDHGFAVVAAGVDTTKVEAVIKAILEEMKKIADGSFTENDLVQAKNHLIGSFMISLETSDDLAMFYGGQEVQLGNIESPDGVIQKTKAVTREEVIQVAKDIFRNDRLNLAMIAPEGLKPDLDNILTF